MSLLTCAVGFQPKICSEDFKRWCKEVSAPVTKTAEELRAEEFVDAERKAGKCTFAFIDAEWARGTDLKSLPRCQELEKIEGALTELTLHIEDAYRGKYKGDILTISHRWEEPGAPDTQGVQFKEVQAFLKSPQGMRKKLLWYDFGSLTQGKRTRAETIKFRWMLQNANVLYLGTEVLILLDISYLSRFWTQFEAWLSMQETTSRGLVAAAADKQQRCYIRCIHNATHHESEKLVQMWSTRRPQEAKQVLGRPDVTLTCAGDRFVQFQKIDNLDADVQKALSETAASALIDTGADLMSLLEMGFMHEVLNSVRALGTSMESFLQRSKLSSVAGVAQCGFSVDEVLEAGFEPRN